MKFSVIIPVYNVEKYLRQCIDSVLCQSYREIEVILVDDGATDNSGIICDEYAEADLRVKVIHKKNGGLSSARNAGIEYATGDYIIFLDSDDYWWSSNMLINIHKAATECPDTYIAWGFQRCAESETTIFNNEQCEFTYKRYSFLENYRDLLANGSLFASAWQGAIPRSWFSDNNLRFVVGDVSEDVEWYADLLLRMNDVVIFGAEFYVYRIRKGSLSNSNGRRNADMMKKHVIHLIDRGANTDSTVLNTYTSEQIANFIIILSRTKDYQEYLTDEYDLPQKMKYAVRKRSRLIYRSAAAIGLRGTIRLLQLADRII